MADLGNLSFGILYKDDPKQLDKIKERALKKLQDMNLVTKVSGSVNKKELLDSVKSALGSERFKIGVIIDKADTAKVVRDALEKAGLNTNYSASDLRAARARAEAAKSEAYVNSQRELARQRAAAATKAELGLAAARERSANAAHVHTSATLNMNGAMRSQMSVSGELRDQILALYSVYTLERFVKGLVEIGGEFEQQELALSAMLNDAGKAHEIFGQIKNLAVVSPFGVRELNDYTKQLKAFSIPFNELYETTKRLADISAGVGVDMGRIILAYGQVRSAAFLRGQELRQFTEAGIPMVDALADKFSKLENRVVSAGEVIDMISKKKVSFEDVKDVLWGMTGEGGQFNNMQEVLSESLSAKWKNLGDAIDIMMADIASSMNGALKGAAEMLTELTSSWQELVPVLHTAIIAFGTYKVAAFANSRILSSEYATTVKSILSKKQQEAAVLRVASAYRTLSATERFAIQTSSKMTLADYEQMARTGVLTKNKLLYLAAIKKITVAQAEYIAISAKMGVLDTQQINKLTFLRVGVMQLRNALHSVGLAMKSLLFNPYTIAFAGISAAMELVYKSQQKGEDMEKRINDISKTANEGFKNLNSEAKKFADINPFSAKESSLVTSIEKIKEVLRDYSPVWADTFNGVFSVDNEGNQINSIAEQYVRLRNSLDDVKEGYKILSQIKSVAEDANADADGWFDESFAENLKDASSAYDEMGKRAGNITADYVKYYEAMQKVIDSNKDFAKVADGASLKNQLMLLRAFPKALKDFGEYTRDVQGNYNVLFIKFNESISDYKENLATAGEDLHSFIDSYKSRLQGLGINIKELSEPQKIAIALNITQFMDAIEGLNPELRKIFLRESLEREFKIRVTTEFEDKVQALTQIQNKFDEATNKQFTAQIKTSTDPNEIIDNIQKAYKEANSAVKQMKPILLKFGVKFNEEGKADLDSAFNMTAPWIKSMAEEFNKRQSEIIGGDKGSIVLGFPVKDVKDSKKDALAEKLKERVSLLKDAYAEYKKWNELVGKEDAIAKVKGSGIFDSLFKGKEPVDIDNYKEELNKLLGQLDDKTKERRELKVSIRKVLLDIDANSMKEASEKTLSDIDKYISNAAKKWDIYKSVLSSTSNKKLAMQLAFGSNIGFDNVADELQAKIQDVMQNDKRVNVDFDALVGMNIKDIEQNFGKPLANLVKNWQEETGKLKEETVKNFIDILKRSADFGEQIAAIDAKLQKDIADLENNSQNLSNSDKERRRKFLTDEADKDKSSVRFEEFKQTSDWVKVFDDLDRVSTSTLNEMMVKISEFAHQAGLSEKVTKQLVEAMRKLREESIDRNPFQGLSNAIGNHSKWSFAKDRLGNNDSYTFEKDERGFKKGETINKKNVDNGLAESNDDMEKSALDIANKFKAVSDAADMLGGMFENLGVNMDGFLGGITDILGGAASGAQAGAGIASALGAAGPWGAAAGAAIGMLSAVFAMHDKKQEKIINESKQRVKELENLYGLIDKKLEYSLGSGTDVILIDAKKDEERLNELDGKINAIRSKDKISIFDIMALSEYAKESEKLQKRVKANNEGGAYGYQRALMQEQMSELEKQRQAEIDKKKTDDGKVADYENQIAELKQQIKDFAEEMADSLYGINLKDWASQLGDALYGAWQKGEDGAEAFKKKAAEIMGDVMNSVLKLAILEPAMKNLQSMLFGEDGQSGMFGKDFKLDDSELENIADYLMGVSSNTDYYYDALDKLNEYMEKKYGVSMKDEAESSGLSKGIEGVTEDTANLLASYLNSVRSDVAMKLQLVRQIVDEHFPRMNLLAEAQLTELKSISRNTASSAKFAEENAKFAEEIRDILYGARLSRDKGLHVI